jgi:hypothetical protein
MEVGIGPGYSGSRVGIAVPIKVGFSVNDYYQLARVDHRFGYFSIAGIVTVPLGGTTKFGAWIVHFGGEYQRLGTYSQFFNGGD